MLEIRRGEFIAGLGGAAACSQKLSVDFVAARTRKVSGRKTLRKFR